ncbi:hypothetical protein D1113_01535 [Mycoplasmopsis gallopavonis]|uniref:Uncharacterized protein n=1 Tax=Mycoplasmopsis gallopavonis TaxID=76629 RepID=A0A449AZE3_9BACT|nr:hypothetical protein D1113_01535 [Mycoplasmopsis gallopavonis]VEU72845.1 Uncharacterised protein [Mycoplasmopsis gallopavonis]
MFLKKYQKNYERCFWFFLTSFSLIFLIVFKWHNGLFFGYAIGGLISYLFYKLNWITSGWILTTTNKVFRYIFYFFKSFFIFLVLGIVFYLSIFVINSAYLVKHPNSVINDFYKFNRPINFITLMTGLSLNFITIIVVNLFDFLQRKSKHKKGEYGRNT